mgnify:CR=1 FL=1
MDKHPLFNYISTSINDGLKGLNKGIPTNLPIINKDLCGITKGTYTLIGAELGCGKSTFVIETYLTSCYEYMRNIGKTNKLKIIFFTLEMKKSILLIKLLCRKIYLDHGISIDLNTMLSRGDKSPDQQIVDLSNTYREYFDNLDSSIQFIDTNMTGAELTYKLFEISKEFGKWENDDVNSTFVPNDREQCILVIVDHLGLIKCNKYGDKKGTIDMVSEYAVRLRNKCNFSFVFISQFNREQSGRERSSGVKYGPQLSDFKDTGNTQEDADVVLGLYNPARYKIKEFLGYNIELFGNKFRSLHILKNRYGWDSISAGLMYYGKEGHYKQLPEPQNVKYDYLNDVIN